MRLLINTNNNKNFYVKDGYLYNINKDEKLEKLQDKFSYDCGTFLTFFEKGVRVENRNFGRVEFKFFDNQGNLLDQIYEQDLKKSDHVYMYVMENGILSIKSDFSNFPCYVWTKYNKTKTVNYNIDNIIKMIDSDLENGGRELWTF